MTDSPSQSPTVLRVERTYRAPAQAVFDAWTNPEVMRRWWHAGTDWENTLAEVDLRVGGRYRVSMRTPDGQEYSASGEYTEVRPPERLAFTWTWAGEDSAETLIEIEFSEAGGATTVVLTQSGLRDEDSKRRHARGWEEALDNLARKVIEV
jgi:uncharacterized protein YndB with AHSA1/START domain